MRPWFMPWIDFTLLPNYTNFLCDVYYCLLYYGLCHPSCDVKASVSSNPTRSGLLLHALVACRLGLVWQQ